MMWDPWRMLLLYDYDTYPKESLDDSVTLLVQNQLDPVHPVCQIGHPSHDPRSDQKTPRNTSIQAAPPAFLKLSPGLVATQLLVQAASLAVMFEKPRRTYICTPMFHGGAAFALLPPTFSTGGTDHPNPKVQP